ncbi:MAG: LysR family transcriptional regulator [Rhodobacteraceae bacterium]|nr:LysR family transcriptional regulator [Paracoccaceae bacterium]
MARLRATLDDPLFVRQGSQMMPTPFAGSIIGPVRDALDSLRSHAQNLDVFDPKQAQRLMTIGIHDVLEASFLPHLIQRIKSDAPGVDIASVRAVRNELEDDLIEGALDMAIDVGLPLSDAIAREKLFHMEHVVVVRTGHPLCAGPFGIDDYLAYGHVQVSARRFGAGFVDIALAQLNKSRRVELRCQQNYSACRVVSQTDLIATIPKVYALLAATQFETRILPLPLTLPQLDVYLYWHASADRDVGNLWVRERFKEVVGQVIAAGERPV